MTYAYYNGTYSDFRKIKIPLTDRAIFFGDGIYDAAIGKKEKIYLFEEHLERFLKNRECIGLPLYKSEEEIKSVLKCLAEMAKIDTFFLYFQLSGYSEERCHAPRSSGKSNFLAFIKPVALPTPESEIDLTPAPYIRQRFCNIKTLNLLGSVMAAVSAQNASCQEAVFVDGETVTECSHSNIAIVKDGVLTTHPTDNKILPGIMREKMLAAAKRLQIPIYERAFSVSELLSADDVLITSTSRIISRAKSLDGVRISVGKRDLGNKIMEHMFKDFENFC